MTKQSITKQQETVSCYELDGTLKKLQEWVTERIAEYGEDAMLDWQPNHWESYDSSPSPRFVIQTSQLETDEEYAIRIKAEQERDAAQLERDRKEFERLQAKFGDK